MTDINNAPDGTNAAIHGSCGSERSAGWHLASNLRLWPVAVAGLALDLWSKHWAFTRLGPGEKMRLIPHLTSFERSLNTGALFGLGQGWTPLFVAASILALAFVLFLFVQSTRDRLSMHIALGLVLGGALGNLYDRVFAIADVITIPGPYKDVAGRDVEKGKEVWTVYTWPEGKAGGHRERQVPISLEPEVHRQGVVRDFIKIEPRIEVPIPFTEDKKLPIHYPWVFNIADVLLVVGVGLLMLNFWWDRQAEKRAAAEQAGSSSVARVANGSS